MTGSPFEIWLEEYPGLQKLSAETLSVVRCLAEDQVDRVHELVKIGMALSAEKHLDRLLEMIITEARRLTNADGGTLYIKSETEEVLEFMIIQNDSLQVKMGGSGKEISWPNVPLFSESGKENHTNVSAHCALTGQAINIADVYNAEGFDFQGTKEFDRSTGYRSRSMLLVPMRDHEDEIIGVLQLLNARDRKSGEIVSFQDHEIEDCKSLASQAAIAVTNMRLVKGLENLLDSFLKSIAAAIDEKSPYTAGHVERVAALTERIALMINQENSGKFGGVNFSDEELAELRMAAWMHDVGKITTPEHVVDKSTKLETIFDRIELVRCRMEIVKRDLEIAHLRAQLASREAGAGAALNETADRDREMTFLEQMNQGGEFLGEEEIKRIKQLAGQKIRVGESDQPLLGTEEMENLLIRRGTLTDAERAVINNHVNMTIRMLAGLPFPKKFRKVPLYAGMHHERLDGSGYPLGVNGEAIPLAARILAVADVFEALTAADRPYKKGKSLSEAMEILESMVLDGHLDADICDLIVESGLVEEVASELLSPAQLDNFSWQGKVCKFKAAKSYT